MAAEPRVEIVGLDELAAGTKELARNIDRRAPTELGRVAELVAQDVKGRVPKLTGALAASTRGRSLGEGASVVMGEGVPYAHFVEYGGRGHPTSAQGNYLYPAAQDAEPAIVAAATRAADQAIGATSWPHPS